MQRLNNKGFTLIELIIVIVILAFLAAIIVPNVIYSRNKAYCVLAESNVEKIAKSIDEYYATAPSAVIVPTMNDLNLNAADYNKVTFLTSRDPRVLLIIKIADDSGRCPPEYQSKQKRANDNSTGWDSLGNYYYVIKK